MFERTLAQKIDGEHTEHHMAACAIHEGLETDEWRETLHDFARLFQVKNSLG